MNVVNNCKFPEIILKNNACHFSHLFESFESSETTRMHIRCVTYAAVTVPANVEQLNA